MYYENLTTSRSLELLTQALASQCEVRFWYNARLRVVRPHALTQTTQGEALWAYQVDGQSQSGSACDLNTLKCFYLEKFEDLRGATTTDRVEVLAQTFAKNPYFREHGLRGDVLRVLPDCVEPELVQCEVVLLDLSRDPRAFRLNSKTHGETPIHVTLSVAAPETLDSMVEWFVKRNLCLQYELTDPDGLKAIEATISNIVNNCVEFRFPTRINKDQANSLLVLSSGVL